MWERAQELFEQISQAGSGRVIDGNSDYAATPYIAFPSRAWQWYGVRLRCEGSMVRVWITSYAHLRSLDFTWNVFENSTDSKNWRASGPSWRCSPIP